MFIYACTVFSGVWVVGFDHEWILLSVLETIDHEATVTSIALGIAVDQVLLREVLEIASGNLEGTFDGTCGGKGPA